MTRTLALLSVMGSIAFSLAAPSLRAQVSFPGPELLGRPTDHSVTINVVPNAAIQAYFEYGTQKGGPYPQTNPSAGASGADSTAANTPLVVELSGLTANTQYYYRMVYRQAGTSSWTTRAEGTFHTQRPPGSTFTFTVGSDSHINIVFGNTSLYQQTMRNVASESPDFHLDLGDTFAMDGVTTQSQSNSNYLNLRSYFGLMSPSVPLFLALGNHEQEEGWHLGDTNGNLATSPPVMSTNARETYYLNPDPLLDSFYSGNTDTTYTAITSSSDHAIQDYYAWTWGDALFVVIDPYWYTTVKPYAGNEGGGEPGYPTLAQDADRWRWTLGFTQYQWLEQTLKNSTAKYKFIFAHQVAGGMDDYGRGGANAVPYVEWGGYDIDGTTYDFNSQRTAWDSPEHQLLVKYGVTAFFHGHDHEFAYEKRDGVVYQLVPMAADATYGYGFNEYHSTDPYTISVLPNSGHLEVTVSPAQVTVAYVRAFLPGAGTNGSVAYSYTMQPTGGSSGAPSITATGGTPQSQTIDMAFVTPLQATLKDATGNPMSGATVTFTAPASGASGTFAGSASVLTDGSGVATAPTFTANSTAGSYSVTATAAGVSLPAAFSLTNNSGPAASITATAGTPQSATINTAFATALQATVKDGSANPVAGVQVTFAAPGSGASGTFSGSATVTTNSSGVATAPTFTANGTTGSYTATARGAGVGTAAGFNLTNNPVPSFTPVRINSGGATYTDSLGQGWNADTSYSGGSSYSTSHAITNTSDQTLYKTARYGGTFNYSISAPAGKYAVTLKFAEPVWSAKGKRVFNVAINGTAVLSNFDIFASAGAEYRAVDEIFTVTSTGTIKIQFSAATAGNPLVNAIQVVATQ